MKQFEVLQWAFSFLKEHNREENVANLLFIYHTKQRDIDFYMNMNKEVPCDIYNAFVTDVKAHALSGVPVQHLIGHTFFYGREFIVSKDVLIPRLETEELVEHVIKFVENNWKNKRVTIIDAGTGSGVIAITIAKELSHCTVYATDISEAALKIAKINAKNHQVDVQFLLGDFLKPVMDINNCPTIIVSNPPYIAYNEKNTLADTVKDFDPSLALFANNDGLAAYETIVSQLSKMRTTHPRFVAFEIGYQQANAVTKIIKKQFPSSHVNVKKDINENERIISFLIR